MVIDPFQNAWDVADTWRDDPRDKEIARLRQEVAELRKAGLHDNLNAHAWREVVQEMRNAGRISPEEANRIFESAQKRLYQQYT